MCPKNVLLTTYMHRLIKLIAIIYNDATNNEHIEQISEYPSKNKLKNTHVLLENVCIVGQYPQGNIYERGAKTVRPLPSLSISGEMKQWVGSMLQV